MALAPSYLKPESCTTDCDGLEGNDDASGLLLQYWTFDLEKCVVHRAMMEMALAFVLPKSSILGL